MSKDEAKQRIDKLKKEIWRLNKAYFIDDKSDVWGTLQCTGDVFCGKEVKIHGNIVSHGDVNIGEKTRVDGKVSGNRIFLSKTATVKGTLLAKNGISFIDVSQEEAIEKVKRFESDADVVDEVKEILE